MFGVLRRFETYVADCFHRYGEFVGTYPLPFLLLPNLLTLSLVYGIVKMPILENIGFLPNNVPSIYETRNYLEFSNSSIAPYIFEVLIRRKDGGNMLNSDIINQYLKLFDILLHNVTYQHEDKQINLDQLCNSLECWNNQGLATEFAKIYEKNDWRNSPNIQLSYPYAKMMGKMWPIHYIIANVTFDQLHTVENAYILRILHTVVVKGSPYDRGKIDSQVRILNGFGEAFMHHFKRKSQTDEMEFHSFYSEALSPSYDELSTTIGTKIAASFACLLLFTITSCLTTSCLTSKAFEAAAGIYNTILAIISAFGILNLHGGYGWSGLVIVTPFLVLAIGVDDMFVIIGAWQNSDSKLTVPKRLGYVMSYASVSVTMTSVTNVVSFAVGVTQDTYIIKLFSLYTSVALAFEWFYQMTFFSAVMAYSGYREEQRKSLFCCPSPKLLLSEKGGGKAAFFLNLRRQIFHNVVLPLLNYSKLRLTVVLLFALHLVFGLFGCITIDSNFSPERIVLDTNELHNYFKLAEQTIHREVTTVNVVVNRAPNFQNVTESQMFYKLTQELQDFPNVIRQNPIDIWLNDYTEWLKVLDIDDTQFYQPIQTWFEQQSYPGSHIKLIKQIDNTTTVESFDFTVNYQNFGNFVDKVSWFTQLRSIAARYQCFNVTVFSHFGGFIDQLLTLPDNVMQDAGVATLVIAFITLLVANDLQMLFWVIYFVLTVETGVVGFLRSVLFLS